MPNELPLPALVSAAFVAFTIEADNEAERALPHVTTSFGATGERGSVWLTSLAMWFNCLRGLADTDHLSVAELEQRVRMPTNLDGMRRWGYITIDGVGRVRRGEQHPQAQRGSWLALTRRGRAAEAVWRPLTAAVERRWRERFGADSVERLRSALVGIAGEIDVPLPDFIPINGIGRIAGGTSKPHGEREREADADLPLVSLLARLLMQFELEFERDSPLAMAPWSNLIRVLDTDTAVAIGELPRLTGVSSEALAPMIRRLERAECVVVEPGPARGRQARLASGGAHARDAGWRRISATLDDWDRRYGAARTVAVRSALVPIAGDGTRGGCPLFTGLEPPAEGWRAQVTPPELLPWWPMVLHRGGYPDGS